MEFYLLAELPVPHDVHVFDMDDEFGPQHGNDVLDLGAGDIIHMDDEFGEYIGPQHPAQGMAQQHNDNQGQDGYRQDGHPHPDAGKFPYVL